VGPLLSGAGHLLGAGGDALGPTLDPPGPPTLSQNMDLYWKDHCGEYPEC
jgi:hypothetical protein